LEDFGLNITDNGSFPAGELELREKFLKIVNGKRVNFWNRFSAKTNRTRDRIEAGAVAVWAGQKVAFFESFPSELQLLLIFSFVVGVEFWWFGKERSVTLAGNAPTMWAIEGEETGIELVEGAA
jgi:hypothetical protein